jgi:hypothetical protein
MPDRTAQLVGDRVFYRPGVLLGFHLCRRSESRRLRKPLDAAGNRSSRSWVQRAQLRELRRTRPCVRGFPSDARAAPLAWFASAACSLAGERRAFREIGGPASSRTNNVRRRLS